MRSDLNDHVELFACVIGRIWKEEMLLPNWLLVAANLCRSKIIFTFNSDMYTNRDRKSVV